MYTSGERALRVLWTDPQTGRTGSMVIDRPSQLATAPP
jgi:hypothetical protein